ncbi:hypothetical protein DYB31_016483 [Aphanomyces astaci]|uniref:Uncharacterized protein n=1 Tax=Aphanomyces astaci TaxID=112090 RepID=A0A397EIB7_APHAT|nr:hypothetical protein DYB31_016483 [Aphanomyces astaci]
MSVGNQRQLESSDLWPLQQENQCDFVNRQFEPKYHATKSIVKASLSVFGQRALFIGFLQLVAMVASLYGPIVLQQVVSSVDTTNWIWSAEPLTPEWHFSYTCVPSLPLYQGGEVLDEPSVTGFFAGLTTHYCSIADTTKINQHSYAYQLLGLDNV